MLRQNNVKFGVNVDVTTYTDGVRETHNIPGRAHPGTFPTPSSHRPRHPTPVAPTPVPSRPHPRRGIVVEHVGC